MAHRKLRLLAVTLAASLGLSAGFAGVASAHYTKKERRAVKRALLKELRRHPGAIRRPRFIRRASHVGLDMPLTVRLNPKIDDDANPATPPVDAPSDDTIRLDLGADATTDPAGVEAGVQDVLVSGRFSMLMRFGRDTVGYGTPGLVELKLGAANMSMAPLDLIDAAPPCGDAGALLETGPVALPEAPPQTPDRRGGFTNLFAGQFFLRVYGQPRLNALRRGSLVGPTFVDSCADPYVWTDRITSNVALPLQLDGRLGIRPAITADGRLRLFTLVANDAVIPQDTLAATIRSCSDPALAGGLTIPETDPAPGVSCDAEAGDELAFAGTVKAVLFTAEVLLGDVP